MKEEKISELFMPYINELDGEVVYINDSHKEELLKELGEVIEVDGRYFYKNVEFVFDPIVPFDNAYAEIRTGKIEKFVKQGKTE